MITYRVKKLKKVEIFNYLKSIDQYLTPKLSSRVDLRMYSGKLYKNAVFFCACDINMIVGIISCYLNDYVGNRGYISSFSVLEPYRRRGIATNLLKILIDYAYAIGVKEISLRVYRFNKSAIIFYEKNKFQRVKEEGKNDFILMSRSLIEI